MTHSATYPTPDPDAVGSEPPRPSGRRTTVIAGVTAATLVVVGAGAYAAVQFLSGGVDAEKALPASSVAMASIDLDPGAAQKVEAIKTLRKFPALRKQLGINSTGDLRRAFFDEAVKDSGCKNLSYDADVKPWIGDSAAVAAVPFDSKKVTPVIALAVTDQDKASAAFKRFQACDKGKDKTAWAFTDGFALLSDTQAHADEAVRQAKASPLSDDAAYQRMRDQAGDSGIVNFYVAKAAATYLADQAGDLVPSNPFPSDLPSSELSPDPSALPTDFPSDFPSDLPSGVPSGLATLPTDLPSGINSPLTSSGGAGASAPYRAGDDHSDKVKKALKNFRGAAGALRFADGGVELEMVGDGLPDPKLGSDGGSLVASLPQDTAAAIGVGVPSDFASKLVKNLSDLDLPLLGSGGQLTEQLQSQLGLSLPDDLQTILGKGVALSVGGKAPASLASISSPADLAAGITIAGGDATKIKSVVSKLEEQAGGAAGALQLHVEDGNGKVGLSFDPDYATDLTTSGSLGEAKRFATVVPHAKTDQFVAYVDFDSDWAKTLSATDQQAKDNLGPLQALGLSAWRDGSTSHLLLKVTTD